MSRGNPGPYVDASTALFTNEAVGGGRGWKVMSTRMDVKHLRRVLSCLQTAGKHHTQHNILQNTVNQEIHACI